MDTTPPPVGPDPDGYSPAFAAAALALTCALLAVLIAGVWLVWGP
jgi:uncharacterized membrane protein YjjP (DUF1212 family)